jgi:hypothetical protein
MLECAAFGFAFISVLLCSNEEIILGVSFCSQVYDNFPQL